jgi:Putative phage tail protein
MAEIVVQALVSIGFSLLKAWLDPVQIEGATSSTERPSSQYGDPITKVFGYSRCSGSLIWALEKVDRPFKSGGKGTETTNHAYYGNFAYLIGHGEMDLQVIYLNNKVWWSIAEDAGITQLNLNKTREKFFTFYRGSSTQLPDPLIQADRGVARTTAYRDYAYIVFKDLPLTEYGQSFPLPSFEIISSAEYVGSERKKAGQIEGIPYTIKVSAFNNRGVQEFITAQVPNAIWGVRIMNVIPVQGNEKVRGEVQAYGKGYVKTIAVGTRWGTIEGIGPTQLTVDDIQPPTLATPTGDAAATATTGASQVAVFVNGYYKIQWTRLDGDMVVDALVYGQPPFIAKFTPINTNNPLVPNPAPLSYFANPGIDQQLISNVICDANGVVVVTDNNRIMGIHGWQFLPAAGPFQAITLYANTPIVSIDYHSTFPNSYSVAITNIYSVSVSEAQSGLSTGEKMVNILNYVMDSCGIPNSQRDFSRILSLRVRGYRFSGTEEGKSWIEKLMRIYLFSFYKDGGKLVAEYYGNEDALSEIVHGEDFLVVDNQTVYTQSILDPEALPGSMELTYSSKNYHLRPSNQIARRYIDKSDQTAFDGTLPAIKQNEINPLKLRVDALLDNTEAITLAHKIFSIVLSRRRSYTWIWPLENVWIKLNQVLSLQLPYSDYKDKVVVESIDLGKNNSLVIKASSFDAAYKDILVEAPEPVVTNVYAAGGSNVNFVILDIPVWRSEQTDSIVYIAAYASGWNGAAVFGARNLGDNFTNIASVTERATVGKLTTNFLPGISEKHIDYHSSIVIKLQTESANSFVSIGDSAFLDSSSNLILVGDEILKFKTATLIGPGEYRLKTLQRGLLGTWQRINNHSVGETAVLLNSAITSVPVSADQINQLILVKVLRSGGSPDTTGGTPFMPVGNSLKPLPVVNVVYTKNTLNGSLKFSWQRMPRKNSAWVDFSDVPLVEVFEKYVVDIRSANGDYKRSFVVSVAEFIYPAAEIVQDHGAQLVFNVEIFQLSDTIGRGYVSKKVVNL